MDAKYVAASKVTKEVVLLRKFLIGLKIIPLAIQSMILFCDNN